MLKKRVMRSLLPLSVGILVLTYVMLKPRFQTYQGSDVLMLVAGGALLAVGLGILFGRIKPPGE